MPKIFLRIQQYNKILRANEANTLHRILKDNQSNGRKEQSSRIVRVQAMWSRHKYTIDLI